MTGPISDAAASIRGVGAPKHASLSSSVILLIPLRKVAALAGEYVNRHISECLLSSPIKTLSGQSDVMACLLPTVLQAKLTDPLG